MCSDKPIRGWVFSTFLHAELEAQKKRIAETPENGDNDEGDVLALPSEQVDENHVAVQQSDASEQTKQAEKKRPEGIPTEANFENSKRFGKKIGQHMEDLGLNPELPSNRQKFKDLINATIQNASRIKRGFYTKQEPNVLCYEKNDMIVLTRQNGEIITAYTQATSRKEHIPIEKRKWYQKMKTIFDEEE